MCFFAKVTGIDTSSIGTGEKQNFYVTYDEDNEKLTYSFPLIKDYKKFDMYLLEPIVAPSDERAQFI